MSSVWHYGELVEDQGVKYRCLLSGDIPRNDSGVPNIKWLKLGMDDGTDYRTSYDFSWYDRYTYFNYDPCMPKDKPDVRVVVRELDWLKARGAQAPQAVSTTKVVEDWPISCPKCGRAKSAYLGLNQYACKWGCYARA